MLFCHLYPHYLVIVYSKHVEMLCIIFYGKCFYDSGFCVFVCFGSSFSSSVPMKGLWEHYPLCPCKFFAICLWPLYLKVSEGQV